MKNIVLQPICDVARIASLPFVSCATEDLLLYGKFLPRFVNALIVVLGDSLGEGDPGSGSGEREELKRMMRIEVGDV